MSCSTLTIHFTGIIRIDTCDQKIKFILIYKNIEINVYFIYKKIKINFYLKTEYAAKYQKLKRI